MQHHCTKQFHAMFSCFLFKHNSILPLLQNFLDIRCVQVSTGPKTLLNVSNAHF